MSTLEGSAEADPTVQAFASWLAEMRTKGGRTLQEMLAEMAVIRDGISSNNVELTEFKRHSTGVQQQMQSQLTDLRENLTNAFQEVTSLVTLKTQSDQDMLKDLHVLQGNLTGRTAELEALKRTYTNTNQQLQTDLIGTQTNLQATSRDLQTARETCDRIYKVQTAHFAEVEAGLRSMEDQVSVGNAEHRTQMLKLQEEIARIHESLAAVGNQFVDHKRKANSVHNQLQSQVWGLEDERKRRAAQTATPASAGGQVAAPLVSTGAGVRQTPTASAMTLAGTASLASGHGGSTAAAPAQQQQAHHPLSSTAQVPNLPTPAGHGFSCASLGRPPSVVHRAGTPSHDSQVPVQMPNMRQGQANAAGQQLSASPSVISHHSNSMIPQRMQPAAHIPPTPSSLTGGLGHRWL